MVSEVKNGLVSCSISISISSISISDNRNKNIDKKITLYIFFPLNKIYLQKI